MSVMIIRVWSFDCDQPGCDMNEDEGDHYLAGAIDALVYHGWTVTGRGKGARHFCPSHKPVKTMTVCLEGLRK
jgi:hypothetical protein